MKKILQLLCILLIVSCGNNNKQNFSLEVKTNRVGDAILLKIDPTANIMDTTEIKNGKFRFTKTIQEEELFRIKFFDGTSFDILANVGEDIKINYQEDELTISGSIGSEKILQLDQKLFTLLEFRDSITKELQALGADVNYEEKLLQSRENFFKKLDKHKDYLKEFIYENKKSKVCLIALFQTYGQSSPVLNIDEDLEIFETVLENLKLNFSNSNHIKLLEDQIEIFKPLAYGQPAPNFSLPNQNKKTISLTDFKGQIILIDFWASWCKPCRMENPKLVKLYKKYSENNFEIISVSLDGTERQQNPRKAWVEAIESDNLSEWIHLSDLTGWDTYVRELYNFNSIPYTVLVDAAGKIAGKNLRGLDLEIKIKELIDGDNK